ncbi:UNVERIFIED_ORG: hypothetical protein ABIC62_002441 [Burkholderia sp. 1595]|uniref:Lsr2 protein n=1 Tax=Paraburkholderia terricola TaxID=169427 RepID=A0ABU1LSJ6_9BURK|nr:hypothetical protein [Paraburkholderia terricola]MDR6409732.1 hypothetical protein [Paraburkholderia terricola]
MNGKTQPGPGRQWHEKTLVEQRGGDEGLARLHHALRYWFRRDTWTPDEAFPLLIGVSPDSLSHGDSHFRYLDDSLVCIAASMHAHGVAWSAESFDDLKALQDLQAVPVMLDEMKRVWDSGDHPPRNGPGYFIEWAQQKGFDVSWLESACDLGLIENAKGKEPSAAASVGATEAMPAPSPADGALSKRERQIRAIEATADALGVSHLRIPTGGKQRIKSECKKNYADLFGVGDDPFREAWQDAVSQSRIRMANHDKFANSGQ